MSHPSSSSAPTGPIETRHGACNLCEAICGLTFQVQNERIISVKGNEADPLSRGHICPKAVALKDLHEDPDRLRQPVRRVGDRWEPISWDQAFDLVVDGLVKVREQHGAHAVAVYQGNPSIHNWGNVTHGHLFFSQLRTRARFSATSVDQLPHHLAAYWLYGHQFMLPIPDIDHTQYMIMLGANPMASNGSLMTAPDMRGRLKSLRERGGKLVVLDPRETETATQADEHLAIVPGSDAAWLLSVIHTLFDEALIKPDAWSELIQGLDALQAAVHPFSPEATAAHTGVDAAITRRLTREFAHTSAAVMYGRMGVSTQAHGAICQWAIQVINLLTGNVDRVGGALLTTPALNLIAAGLMGKGHYDVWRSRVRGAPEFAGELPVSVMAEEMLTPGKGQIRALVTSCGNPVLSTPNGTQLDRALEGLDFMVSMDFYINETSRHADVILPPTCFVEHDHYDLVFLHLAVRNTARYSDAIVPAAPGARHDWQIYSELAQRYARRAWSLERSSAWQRVQGLATRALMAKLSPRRVLALGLRRLQAPVRMADLLAHPEGIDLGPLQPSLVANLRRKRKTVPLLPDAVARELPLVTSEFLSAASGDTLRLIGRRDVRTNNSWMHNSERLVSGKNRCVLWMHPYDAQARQLQDGQSVAVSSRVGRIIVPLHVTTKIRTGVVSLPHGWGHNRAGVQLKVAQAHAGVSINDLTDDRAIDRLSGNATFSAVPVEVSPA
ncbi:molybdopterin-dependent oxidoreductase [Aquabacterium sp.]|uniref:molybdopterin-dependent oxidoreductase n=1 Tax=Aquabacterium sp. TaxID=1872578 RepID=UPI003B68CFF7